MSGTTNDLHANLPPALQTPTTIVTPIAAGMSGAGVYRVETGDEPMVLKVTTHDEPAATWRRTLHVQQVAAAAGIAPQVFHADEHRRAVLSALIVDRGFPAQLGNPATRGAAVVALGQMLAKLHALPIPRDAIAADPQAALGAIWQSIASHGGIPEFVRQTVEQLLADAPPASTAIRVMSHNDVNPSNLVFDGERVMLLDWQTAAPNDPYYDLAAIALFFRFDDETCRQLIAAHDGARVESVPAAFIFFRRCAAVLSGVAALRAARMSGYVGTDAPIESVSSLGDLYAEMRNGTFDIRTARGQWSFGLALIGEGTPVR